jgi:hypothetical protein
MNTVKRYDKADKPEKLRRARKYQPALVDPYRDYLRRRRTEEPGAPVQQLLREIRGLGYPAAPTCWSATSTSAGPTPRARTCRSGKRPGSCSAGRRT